MLKRLGLKLLLSVILFNIFLSANAATTIPTQAWSRDINAAGYKDGAPIGGFGAGTVTWRLNGNFYKTRLNIGAGSDNGSAFTDNANCKFFLYQKPASGAASMRQLDSGLGTGQATYYSLFPKSWVDYYGSQFTVKAKVTQFSPIIPNDYEHVSYPVGIYEWELTNPTAENVDTAIMLTWQNDDFSGVNAQAVSNGNFRGIVLRSGVANPANCNQGEFCLGTEAAAGTTVSLMSAAALGTITTDFSADGVLGNTLGANTIGGIAFKVTLAPGASVKIPIVISWDIPVFQIGGNGGTGKKWYREYTRYRTRTGQNSWAIALDSLNNHDSYESQIDTWQNGVLTNPNYPTWLKSMLFNEMYIYFTAGTAWEAGAASGQTDDPNEDQFSHLESYIYLFYGTSDVRFYGSWALLMNWPNIDKQAVKQFSDSVVTGPGAIGRPPAIGSTAHDLGGQQASPIQCANGSTIGNYYLFDMYNCYQWRASCTWKDLNSKLVLMIYRDYLLTGSSDSAFLNYCWNSVRAAMNMVHSQCAADGLPQSSGIDQTYDDMDLTGTTAYCGSLFLAACQAAKKIADAMGNTAQGLVYQGWLTTGQASFESELWTGTYYKIDTGSTAPTRIMSDQLCGQWYSKALGLGGIVSDAHAVSAWQKVYDNNFSLFTGGANGVCNVMNANGTIDTSTSQTQEGWVGTAWGFVSGMVQQGMTTQANAVGQSLYNTIWNTAQYWFRTPEAWCTGVSLPRAFYYMRGSTVWATKRAYDLVLPVASPTNTPNWTHTITPTNTPYQSPTITATITSTATVNPCITSYRRINCGGPLVTTGGNTWVADQAYVAGAYPNGYGYLNGSGTEGVVANAINNTTDDALYQSGRYGGGLEYRFTVPNGPWRVILKFAEIYTFTNPGQRVFNVSIEGTQVLTNYDIIQDSGARFTAIDEVFDINVSDGFINIVFANGTADVPKIDAIEIIDLSTQCSPTVTTTNLPGTATRTPTFTQTRTYTYTATNTPYYSPTNTPSPTNTRTITPYLSPTNSPTQTITRTNTPFISATITRTLTISPTFTNTPVFTPIRVNCAGPLYTSGSTGFVWAADKLYAANSWGYVTVGATNDRTPHAVANTVDPTLYLTERWSNSLNNLDYAFDIPNGTYEVTLKFTDQYFTAANQRQFNILLEGITMQTNFDIIGEASAAWTAVDKVFIVTVNDGTLNVSLTKGAYDWPLINAIQVLRVYPTPTMTATITPPVTYTFTATRTATFTFTATQTASPANTLTSTAVNTQTFTGTPTRTITPANTLTNTPVNTSTYTPVNTITLTTTATFTPVNTFTFTRTTTPTYTYTLTATMTYTRTSTYTFTYTPTFTRTSTCTITPTDSVSPTITETCTGTPPTPTFTPTVTRTHTSSPTDTVTRTSTMTFTNTASPSATRTNTPVNTATFTRTVTQTVTETSLDTPTFTATVTATSSNTYTATRTPSPSSTQTYTATVTVTPYYSPSVTPSITVTWTGTPPTQTFTPTVTMTATQTRTYTATFTPSLTVTSTATRTATPTYTCTPSFTATVLPSATFTYTVTQTSTLTYTATIVPNSPTCTPTYTATLAIIPTPYVFEITDPVCYPNPYNPFKDGDCSIRVNLNKQAEKLVLKIYTVSFRKVLQYEETAVAQGTHVISIKAQRFTGFASGAYYYKVEGKAAGNETAACGPGRLIIIRDR